MKLKSIIISSLFFIGVAAPMAASAPVAAQSSLAEQRLCEGSGGTYSGGNCRTAGKPQTVQGTFKVIANTLLFLVGAIAVIMIIIGGLRYVTSGGDQAGVNSAKNTILYAIIGVIVAFAGYAIVNFVIDAII